MPTLDEIARAHTDLDADELAWLHLLLADWQIVADLSFADLVLWLPDHEDRGFWAGAQQRPTTGPTALLDDVAGTFVPRGRRKLLEAAYETGRLTREGDPARVYDVPVRVEAIPVRRGGRVFAVVQRTTNLLGVRTPSQLELTYTQTASELTRMIARGAFPVPGQRSDHADTPRVGDGFIRLDAAGRVKYASPNALSVYRHLGHAGDLVGQQLAELTRRLVPPRDRPDEETLSAVLGGRVARDTEIASDGVALILRSLPLAPEGDAVGGMILVRDVTDLRRLDRELVTKEATIREIHHRVKNNLQTIASLLRLQGRRLSSPEAKEALDALAGAELWLKAECLQRIGAFKARGAMHAVGLLSEAERARGVITFSSGNHAQAVALAARSYGFTATWVGDDNHNGDTSGCEPLDVGKADSSVATTILDDAGTPLPDTNNDGVPDATAGDQVEDKATVTGLSGSLAPQDGTDVNFKLFNNDACDPGVGDAKLTVCPDGCDAPRGPDASGHGGLGVGDVRAVGTSVEKVALPLSEQVLLLPEESDSD